MEVKLAKVRIAFPQLFEASSFGGSEPAFSATFLFDPKNPAVAAINAAIEQVAKEKWGAKAADVLKSIRAKNDACLHKGEEKANLAGYEGNMFVSARNKIRPTVIDRNKSPLTAQDGRPYGGCYVNAIIDVWAQDNNYGKRVNASLKGVQFVSDGEAFGGGGVASADAFDEVSEDDPIL